MIKRESGGGGGVGGIGGGGLIKNLVMVCENIRSEGKWGEMGWIRLEQEDLIGAEQKGLRIEREEQIKKSKS